MLEINILHQNTSKSIFENLVKENFYCYKWNEISSIRNFFSILKLLKWSIISSIGDDTGKHILLSIGKVKGNLAVSIKILKLSLSYDLTVPLLNLYSKKILAYIHKKAHIRMSISAPLLTEKLNAGNNPIFYL